MLKNIPKDVATSCALAIILLAFPEQAHASRGRHKSRARRTDPVTVMSQEVTACLSALGSPAHPHHAETSRLTCVMGEDGQNDLPGGDIFAGVFLKGRNGLTQAGVEADFYTAKQGNGGTLVVQSWKDSQPPIRRSSDVISTIKEPTLNDVLPSMREKLRQQSSVLVSLK